DLEVDTARAHGVDLLGEPAEDRGVAALEPDDAPAAARTIDEEPVDLRLAHAVAAGRLAGVDDLGVRRRLGEQRGGDEAIVHPAGQPDQRTAIGRVEPKRASNSFASARARVLVSMSARLQKSVPVHATRPRATSEGL